MLEAILEGVSTLGPIVLLMFLPILIPLITVGIGTLADRKPKKTPGSDS